MNIFKKKAKFKDTNKAASFGVLPDEIGTVTAYLPEHRIFSIKFSQKKWFSFNMSEDSFLEIFEILEE